MHYDFILHSATKPESARCIGKIAEALSDAGKSVLILAQGRYSTAIAQRTTPDTVDIVDLCEFRKNRVSATQCWGEEMPDNQLKIIINSSVLATQISPNKLLNKARVFNKNFAFWLKHSNVTGSFYITNPGGDMIKRLVLHIIAKRVRCVRIMKPFGPTGQHVTWVDGEHDKPLRADEVVEKNARSLIQYEDMDPENVYPSRKRLWSGLDDRSPWKKWLEFLRTFSSRPHLEGFSYHSIYKKYFLLHFEQLIFYLGAKAKKRQGHLLLLPLQNSNESQLTLLADQFHDQYANIQRITQSIPDGYIVLLRRHPRFASGIRIKDLIRLFWNRKVAFSSGKESKKLILDKSFAVITVNSTLGLDALLLGKPTITLGKPFYSGLGYDYAIEDLCELKDLLKNEKLSGPRLNDIEALTEEIAYTLTPGVYVPIFDSQSDIPEVQQTLCHTLLNLREESRKFNA